MASKPGADAPGDPNAIPSAIIAQAEAAIVGNFDDESPQVERQSSRAAKPDYSLYQTTTGREGKSK
jgi:hypothetical protein